MPPQPRNGVRRDAGQAWPWPATRADAGSTTDSAQWHPRPGELTLICRHFNVTMATFVPYCNPWNSAELKRPPPLIQASAPNSVALWLMPCEIGRLATYDTRTWLTKFSGS